VGAEILRVTEVMVVTEVLVTDSKRNAFEKHVSDGRALSSRETGDMRLEITTRYVRILEI
jgi:hypothetical protein